jgi:hypothetical protein
MMNGIVLVCGSRGVFVNYKAVVKDFLTARMPYIFEIIEGCCSDSADQYAEEWAEQNHIPIKHFPANSGNYLKRNIEMVEACEVVVAFWDGYSYGTAHTIATAKLHNKPTQVILLRSESLKGKGKEKVIE